MTDIKLTASGHHILVSSPYHPDFAPRARSLGGKWDGAKRVWRFDIRDEQRVRDLAREIYGTDGASAETVTVRVRLGGRVYNQTAWMFGRRLAHRPSRDEEVRLGDGVILIEGEFDYRGGSVKNPRIGDTEHEGVVLEVRDVPAGHAGLQADGVTVIDAKVDVDALLSERERLLARVAEIDAMLPEPEGAEVTTREAARVLGVSVRTVQRWAQQGKVAATKADGRWVVTITIGQEN